MKKAIVLISVMAAALLTGCNKQTAKSNLSSQSSSSSKIVRHETKSSSEAPRINIHKKYKGFKLATVPSQYRGTWYRGDPYSKKARKLVITEHTVNGNVTYQKVDPNLKLNRHSEKQNKKYSGNIVLIDTQGNSLKVRGFLDLVNLDYQPGQFKNHDCLFLSYGTDPSVINGAIFMDKNVALKYRKYDFTKVKKNRLS